MATVPYHTHTFVIPTASTEEIVEGVEAGKAITPDQLKPVLDGVRTSFAGLIDFETREEAEAWPGADPMPESIFIRHADGGLFVRGQISSNYITVAGQVYGISKDIAPNRIAPTMWFKVLWTGDHQPKLEVAGQVDMFHGALNDMNHYHGDSDLVVNVGDLVDRPTINNTGEPYGYGYKEYLAALRSRVSSIPLAKWIFVGGNHDRDGTGAGMWRDAWTYRSFKEQIGPLFGKRDFGNVRIIWLSDMAGSVGGEILDHAVDWFRRTMERSRSYNVIIAMHQPPDPMVYTPIGDPGNGAFQRSPARITDIIAAHDNVAACFYGHVGSTIEQSTLVTEAHGTTWFNIQMGIPTAQVNGFDLHYATSIFEAGATEVEVRRWNATRHEPLGINDGTFNLKFPLDLSNAPMGTGGSNTDVPVLYGPVDIYASLADFRGNGDPSFGVPDGLHSLLNLRLGDDARNNLTLQGVAIDLYIPAGVDIEGDDEGPTAVAIPSEVLGGRIGVARVSSDDANSGGQWEFYAKSSNGDIYKIAEIRPMSSAIAGINLLAGACLSIDGSRAIDANRHFVLRTYTQAGLASIPSTPAGMLVRVSDGPDGMPCFALSRGSTSGWHLYPNHDICLTSIADTPEWLGQRAIVGGVPYIAMGTSSTADWKALSLVP